MKARRQEERRLELYVEGGGDKNPSLAAECRKAFSKLLEKAGVEKRPRIIACGGRKSAYDQFCGAVREDRSDAWLLVDAEEPAPSGPFAPWAHVKERSGDDWDRPEGVSDEQLQLMNVVMETWLLADRAALRKIFGPRLDEAKLLPEDRSLEAKDKDKVYAALEAATKPTPAGGYGKGAHSFKVLAEVSPQKLRVLPWAERFLVEMGARR